MESLHMPFQSEIFDAEAVDNNRKELSSETIEGAPKSHIQAQV